MELDNSFGYSRDELGRAVWNFVKGMGRVEADLELLEREDGQFDGVHLDLVRVCDAFCDLFAHVLSCGIDGVRNEIIADVASRNGETVTCAEELR